MPSFSVHPHWCGEHAGDMLPLVQSIGSSPLVWGTFAYQDKIQQGLRFIPTGVGNITPTAIIRAAMAVHPHWCGEHYLC